MRNLILLLVLAPCVVWADGDAEPKLPDKALVDAATLLVADDAAALRELPEVPADARPDASKLTEIAPDGAALRGWLEPATAKLWVKDGETWRGPRTVVVVSRQQVFRELEKHTSDSGQQGFYEGRFAKLKATYGALAVPHLIAIFEARGDGREQLERLALEALGQLGYPRLAVPALERWYTDGSRRGYTQELAVALALLGKRERFDEELARYQKAIDDDNLGKAMRARAAGSAGLMWARLGKLDRGLEFYFRATELWPENALTHYNLACTYAKLKRPKEAFASLNQAVDAGFDHWEWMRLDGDLKSLHKDPQWKQLLARQNEERSLRPKQPR